MQPGTQCIGTIYLIASNIQIICCLLPSLPPTTNQYESRILETDFVYLLFDIFRAKVLNKAQNSTSKNVNITV